MPTMITVPIGQRTKSIKFGAAYSPSLSFNPDKKLLVGCSGILNGLGVTVNTVPNPDQVTVDVGAFIQRGIIVDVASAQVVETPAVPTFPLYLVAENANEVHNSSVQYLFTTTPNADSVIIAEWPAGPITAPVIPVHISNCGLRDAIGGITGLIIQREMIVASGGQTGFTLPGPKAYVLGSNKLFVYRNGKKLEVNNDYSEDSPTQFTTNFPSVSGDVYDVIVFQGSPPITSLALLNLTDVTSDLANGIKDPSTLRSQPASMTNPLATLADVNADQNFLVNPGFRYAQRQNPLVATVYVHSIAQRRHGADRWAMVSGTGQSTSYRRVDSLIPEVGLSSRNYGTVSKDAAGPNKIIVTQIVEGLDTDRLAGRTVRFQVKMKFSVAASMNVRLGLLYLASTGVVDTIPVSMAGAVANFNGTGIDPTWAGDLVALAPTLPDGGVVNGLGMDCTLTSGWVRYSACFTLPSDCKNVLATIWSDANLAIGEELNIAEAGLHIGTGIPIWAPRSHNEELRLCQRFLYKTFGPDVLPAAGTPTGRFLWTIVTGGVVLNRSPKHPFPVLVHHPSPFGILSSYNPIDPAGLGFARDETAGVNSGGGALFWDQNGIITDYVGNAASAVGNRFSIQIMLDVEL